MKLSKQVNIKDPIDPEKLRMEKDNSFEMAYAVYIPLDSNPDSTWRNCFENTYKMSLYSMKRHVRVEGNTLRAITVPDEIKARIKWIRQLVETTNRCVEETNKEMKQKEELEQAKRQREENDIEKMRKALKS